MKIIFIKISSSKKEKLSRRVTMKINFLKKKLKKKRKALQ